MTPIEKSLHLFLLRLKERYESENGPGSFNQLILKGRMTMSVDTTSFSPEEEATAADRPPLR